MALFGNTGAPLGGVTSGVVGVGLELEDLKLPHRYTSRDAPNQKIAPETLSLSTDLDL